MSRVRSGINRSFALPDLEFDRPEASSDEEQVVLAHWPICFHEVRLKVDLKEIACPSIQGRQTHKHCRLSQVHGGRPNGPAFSCVDPWPTCYAFDRVVKRQDMNPLPIGAIRARAHMNHICMQAVSKENGQ